MNDIITFDYHESAVRVVTIDDAPWFIATDVASILGYKHGPSMVRLLDDDEAAVHNLHSSGQSREMTIISESGLYNAIFRSRREEAKAFRRWVTGTVLPELRRTGRYSLLGAAPLPPLAIGSAEGMRALAAVRMMRKLRGNVAAFDLWCDLGLPTPESALGETVVVDGIDAAIADWAAGRDVFTSNELAAGLGLHTPDLKMRQRFGSVLRLIGFDTTVMRRDGGHRRVWVRLRPTPLASIATESVQ
jgi:prophage antirepressor-like protein